MLNQKCSYGWSCYDFETPTFEDGNRRTRIMSVYGEMISGVQKQIPRYMKMLWQGCTTELGAPTFEAEPAVNGANLVDCNIQMRMRGEIVSRGYEIGAV